MDFNGQTLNYLFDWWVCRGNPDIEIWLDNDGELVFLDTYRAERVARIMRLGDGPCFLNYDAKDDPFTDQEHQELAKFVRANNAKFCD